MGQHTSRAGDGANRFAWETATRPLIEQVLNLAFPRLYDVRWTADCKSEVHLDRLHGVDVVGTFATGQPLTFQAKCLATEHTTLTIEGQSSHDGRLGDWDECLADYLVWVYSTDGESIDRWAVVSRPLLSIATAEGRVRWHRQAPNRIRHNAGSCFWFVQMEQLLEHAPECVKSYAGVWSSTPNRPTITLASSTASQ